MIQNLIVTILINDAVCRGWGLRLLMMVPLMKFLLWWIGGSKGLPKGLVLFPAVGICSRWYFFLSEAVQQETYRFPF